MYSFKATSALEGRVLYARYTIPNPPSPIRPRISNSLNRVPTGSALWSVPDEGTEGLLRVGGWVLIDRSAGHGPGGTASLPQAPARSHPRPGGEFLDGVRG